MGLSWLEIIIFCLVIIALFLFSYLFYIIRQQKIKKRHKYSYFVPRRPNLIDKIKRYCK